MHYVICYDLESDRLREKVAKLLQRHGCNRVQKSVFVAADMSNKHLSMLQRALTSAMEKGTSAPQDSVLLIPLPDACAQATRAIGGLNSILATTAVLPLKIIV